MNKADAVRTVLQTRHNWRGRRLEAFTATHAVDGVLRVFLVSAPSRLAAATTSRQRRPGSQLVRLARA